MHHDYLKYKELKEKVTSRLEQHCSAINQPIFIRDISIVTKPDKEFFTTYQLTRGEKYLLHVDAKTEVTDRLLKLIGILGDIANHYHESYYCQRDSAGDYMNHITRVLFHEFAFYTSEPLKLADFSRLVGRVEDLVKDYQENVHLLLSSFAVVTEDGRLLNTCLYVQCGPEPVIHTFCKAYPFKNDAKYTGAQPYHQKDIVSDKDELRPFVAKDIVISHRSVFEIKTKGGTRYVQAIDICRDYGIAHSRKILVRQISQSTVEGLDILPEQIDHIVTSNTLDLREDLNLSKFTVHIDPNKLFSIVELIVGDRVEISDLRRIISKRCEKTSLTYICEGRYELENLPFGHPFTIHVQEERRLGGLKGSTLSRLARRYNERVTKTQIASILSTSFLTAKTTEYRIHLGEVDLEIDLERPESNSENDQKSQELLSNSNTVVLNQPMSDRRWYTPPPSRPSSPAMLETKNIKKKSLQSSILDSRDSIFSKLGQPKPKSKTEKPKEKLRKVLSREERYELGVKFLRRGS